MRTGFSMDDGEAEFTTGYIKGIADYVNTPQYIGSAVDFAHDYLKQRFEIDMDAWAALHKNEFHHVYEWGGSYGDRSPVGNPAMRLWKLISVHQGNTIGVGFTFLPSIRPTPLHPEEIKVKVERRHTFTWKAPVMEYGQTVTIDPVEALHGRLVFYWEKVGKIVTTTKTIHTELDHEVVGSFSGYFIRWWNIDAPRIYHSEIKPHLEKQVVPRGPGGRFAKGRTKEQSRLLAGGGGVGARQSLTIARANAARGEAQAEQDMKKIAAGYKQGRGGWDNYRGN